MYIAGEAPANSNTNGDPGASDSSSSSSSQTFPDVVAIILIILVVLLVITIIIMYVYMRRIIRATQHDKSAGGQEELGRRNFKNPTYLAEPSAPPSVNTLNNINNAR